MSVPNQKIVIINKRSYTEKFLQIGISEWQQARRDMNYSTFCLYLYLAGNMNGFNLELSKEAFENATGFKKTSYHDGLKKLQDLGYLIHARGNKWLFYTSPARFGGNSEKDVKTDTRSNGTQIPQKRMPLSAQANELVRPANIEINNIDKTNKKDNDSLSAVSDKEIQMYKELDKLFVYNVYSAEDEEIIGDLLENEYYWDAPQERISEMDKKERELMAVYYRKYSAYILEEDE